MRTSNSISNLNGHFPKKKEDFYSNARLYRRAALRGTTRQRKRERERGRETFYIYHTLPGQYAFLSCVLSAGQIATPAKRLAFCRCSLPTFASLLSRTLGFVKLIMDAVSRATVTISDSLFLSSLFIPSLHSLSMI